ncbi:MAG: o-succinylbenzoate synthase [Chlamydiae bacterium]|nr:o-succinylbenzoate synthase [Chlamydiota bacterium]
MRLQTFSLYSYEFFHTNDQVRSSILLNITDEERNNGWGEIAPLPKWSKETLKDCLQQLNQKQYEIINIDWTAHSYLEELTKLELLPAVSFGLESALFSMLTPPSEYTVLTSALLMGSPQEVFEQARIRLEEGYTSAKLKVCNLTFAEAAFVINALKSKFHLRIDVNRAWNTADSLLFFSQFPLDTFDYVEEPFQNPSDLAQFPHPLAVDESFPQELSLTQLESFPTLKALIYKPTIQGGVLGCLSLHEWATRRGVSLVLSSSFESDLALAHVASIAHRLSISTPVGIGTYCYLKDYVCSVPLQFSRSLVRIPQQLCPNMNKISRIENEQMLTILNR